MRPATVLALAGKDLRLFAADRRSMVMSFVAPIAIATFFGFLFANRGDEASPRLPVVVADADGSPVSRALVAGLAADAAVALETGPAEEARQRVKSGKAAVGIVIPGGFGEAAGQALFRGQGKPSLTVLYDPSRNAERAMVKGIVTQHAMEAVSAQMFSGEQGQRFARDSLQTLEADPALDAGQKSALRKLLEGTLELNGTGAAAGGAGAPGLGIPYDTKEEAVTARSGESYNSYAHSFGGMGVQFLLFACIDLAIAMLLERQQGLWKRLRAAPLSRGEVLLARGVSSAAVALLVLAVTFAFGMAVFGIRIQGSVPGFLGVCVATAVMAATFGLLVATVGRTPGATRGVAILAVLLMVMLGGAWVPSMVFPAWMQKATRVVPARWAVDGLDAMTWRGLGLADALPPVAALLGFSVLFAAVAAWRFRWDEAD